MEDNHEESADPAVGRPLVTTLPLTARGKGTSPATEETVEETTVDATTETAEGGVAQDDIERYIIGTWIASEINGEPVSTDEKVVKHP